MCGVENVMILKKDAQIKYSILLIIVCFIFSYAKPVNAISVITGNITDAQGAPLGDVKIALYKNREPIVTVYSNNEGKFTLYTDDTVSTYIKLEKDDPNTPSLDFFPVSKYLYDYDGPLNITLKPAAKLILTGESYIIESYKLIDNIKYTLYDPENNNTIYHHIESQNNYLIPINQTIDIRITCKYSFHQGSQKELSLNIHNTMPTNLERGENVTIDITPYFLEYNHKVLNSFISELTNLIEKMEVDGFYLSYEKNTVNEAQTLLNLSKEYLFVEKYSESYGACKKGYTKLLQTQYNLVILMKEAKDSIGTILAFLAISSIFVSYTFAEKKILKVLGGLTVFAIANGILYSVYPACNTIPPNEYLQLAAYPMITSLIFAITIPYFLKGRERPDGSVPIRNIILTLFYITKRNIKRRKGRFILTLVSVSLFISGFVSLTSFSEVYGLLYSHQQSVGGSEGVLIRAEEYKYNLPTYFPINNKTQIWLENQEEVKLVIPKIESTPDTRGFNIYYDEDYGFVDFDRREVTEWEKSGYVREPRRNFNVQGWIGIIPEIETTITNLNSLLKEGTLPSEYGIVISETIVWYWGIGIGDEINITNQIFTVEGIFWDNGLSQIKEMDGSNYIPLILNIQYSYPCDPKHVVIFHQNQAEKMYTTKISRFSVILRDGYDMIDFAERMVLEGGFCASSITEDGIVSLKMDNYSDIKGAQLVIPWFIVVMNIIVTIMNSMHERKKEIQTLSSIGVNPTQISIIFIVEAIIIGFIGGGLGYLIGMSAYQIMELIGLNLGLHQKISSSWVSASIALSAVSALAGAIVAIRNSLVVTPSQWRRWSFISEGDGFHKPTLIDIPVKVTHGEAEAFADFMLKSLYEMHSYESEKNRKIVVKENMIVLTFSYTIIQQTLSPRTYTSFNKLIIDLTGSNVTVVLEAKGEWDSIRVTGNLVRTMAMRWGMNDKRSKTMKKDD